MLSGIESSLEERKIPKAIISLGFYHDSVLMSEAKSLYITTYGVVDSNAQTSSLDYPIVGNDDSSYSIKFFLNFIEYVLK